MSTNPSHRLIGLDHGLRFTGWGVIDVTGPKLVHVANGSIASKQADPLPTRLLQIESGWKKRLTLGRPTMRGWSKLSSIATVPPPSSWVKPRGLSAGTGAAQYSGA